MRTTETPATKDRRWWALGAICISLFAVAGNTTGINTALPAMGHDLGASVSTLQWAVNSYSLVCAAFVVVGGRLGDMYGRRRVFLIGGVGTFSIASVVIALSPSGTVLVAGRSLQGLASAFIVPATLSIIEVVFPKEQRPTAFGIWGAIVGLGFAGGPLIGGVLTDTLGWRWLWWINLPLMAAIVVLSLYSVPEGKAEQRPTIDVPGVLLIAGGTFSLLLWLDVAPDVGWTTPGSLGLLLLSVLLLGGFFILEPRRESPLVHLGSFRIPHFLASNLGTFLVTMTLFGFLFLINLFLQDPVFFDYSAATTGLALMPFSLALFAVSLGVAHLTKRFGMRWTVACGFALAAAGFVLISTIGVTTTYTGLLPSFFLMGAGFGITMAPTSSLGMGALPESAAGEASGVVNMSRYLGGSLGVAVTALLYSSGSASKTASSRQAVVTGFSHAVWFSAVVAAAGAVAWVALVRDPPHPRAPLDGRTPSVHHHARRLTV